jgi:RNA polymerase sigma-70 factor, ECF subfamily
MSAFVRSVSKKEHDSYSDQEWAKNIQTGSYAAFENLFLTFYEEMVIFVETLVHKPEVAEELVQEVFYNIWKERQDWKPRGTLRAYLFGAARNNSFNYLRRQRIANRIQWHMLFWIEEEAERPDHAFEYEEFSQAVQRAIDALPVKRRQVFVMSRQQGLSYAEIAAVLNISVNTVENQMVRAMGFLRQRLAAFLLDRK